MINGGYFRFPTVAGDTVCFVSEDDLWTVRAEGGVARRLTANLADVSTPALSPAGDLVAFTSREEHHLEVWVMDATGGPARRLSWFGANTAVRGWTPDGRVLAVSDVGQPFVGWFRAYAIDARTAREEALPFGVVRTVSWAPDGVGVVLGRNTADPARWKRYRGGTAGQLWIDPRGTGSFKRLVELGGNLASPLWVGRRVYFLSDHEGVGNLYSCRPSGGDVRRHTDHDEYYARAAATDGRSIVYQHAAEIWQFDPDVDESRRIDVDFRSPRVQRNRRFVPAERFLTGYSVHPDGHALVVETRGKLFTFPLWEEAVRQHGRAQGVRYRLARWSGDGRSVIAISDETGEDTVEVHEPGNPEAARRLDGLDLGVVADLALSPTGDLLAVANQRHELLLVDVGKGTVRELDRSEAGFLGHVCWSPDGQWLAYTFQATHSTQAVKLCRPATGETHFATTPVFLDYAPSWDPKGDYLYFLSRRTFDPVYDSYFFDLGFPRAVRPYLLTLRRELPSPFVPKPKGMGADDAADAKARAEPPPATPPTVTIDLEGIERRVAEFPLPLGRWQKIVGIPGKVLLLSEEVEGSLGRDWAAAEPEAKLTLESWDLAEQRHEVLVAGVSGFEVSRDGGTLVYAAGRRLRALKAGQKPPEGPEAEGPPGRRNGWIDLQRVRVSVEPAAEWRQMYGEGWRLQRDHFWVSDMSGVDWRRVRDRYLPLIDKVGSRFEFSDLMWEMQGELGTSHAYELGGDYRPAPAYAMGFLGADLDLDPRSGRWRITRVVHGDDWDAAGGSPLGDPGVEVAEGATLLAVGGRPVGRDVSPASLLVHQAGQAVEITVGDARGRKPRTVVVRTMADERPARYRQWVEDKRRQVHEATAGRVGYLHVPDMGPQGYSEFHRAYLAEVSRDALIVDVRNNGGGNVSQVLLEKLARRRIGCNVARWGPVLPYPADSPAGPLLCLTDENAGSDGDIFTHAFKLMGLGPVVGKRTWGGVIGIAPRHQLVDGSMTTQPEYSYWFSDVGWAVENYGTDPDVEVDMRPQDWVAGRDPQLEKGLDLVQRALRRFRARQPDLAVRPNLALPVLPPRSAGAGPN